MALELLQEAPDVSPQVKEQIEAILVAEHKSKYMLLNKLYDYLNNKNANIFDADTLMKQGHELGKSKALEELGLSREDTFLLELFRQVRA